jgi:hypothetical protein
LNNVANVVHGLAQAETTHFVELVEQSAPIHVFDDQI